MTLAHDGEPLPCGVDVGLLVDQVAEGLPPVDPEHQATCEFCQAALADLEPLWGQVRELAREDVVVPARLLATVMQAVRAEQIPGRAAGLSLRDVLPQLVSHALLVGERGTLRISDSVIAQILVREALATPGVSALDSGGVRSMLRATPGVEVTVDGSRVAVRLRLVVDLGLPIPKVLRAVRLRAAKAVRVMTGLETSAIDITVTDVRDSDH